MNYVLAALALGIFGELLRRQHLNSVLREMFARIEKTLAVLSDPSSDDLHRQNEAQAASIAMAGYAVSLTKKHLLALSPAFLLLAAAVKLDFCDIAMLEKAFLSWPIILLGTLFFAFGVLFRKA